MANLAVLTAQLALAAAITGLLGGILYASASAVGLASVVPAPGESYGSSSHRPMMHEAMYHSVCSCMAPGREPITCVPRCHTRAALLALPCAAAPLSCMMRPAVMYDMPASCILIKSEHQEIIDQSIYRVCVRHLWMVSYKFLQASKVLEATYFITGSTLDVD